jgi:Leucine-rich repeat (LRR) protein
MSETVLPGYDIVTHRIGLREIVVREGDENSNNAKNLLNGTPIPENVESLFIDIDIGLETLPSLSNIKKLTCINNKKLTTLPEVLPEKLTWIYVKNNGLTMLPESLSRLSELDFLDCGENNLTELPDRPASLRTFRCNDNKLTGQLNFNEGVINVYCQNNELTSLGVFPLSLNTLNCENNKLRSLPPFPTLPGNFYNLSCRGNNFDKFTCYRLMNFYRKIFPPNGTGTFRDPETGKLYDKRSEIKQQDPVTEQYYDYPESPLEY